MSSPDIPQTTRSLEAVIHADSLKLDALVFIQCPPDCPVASITVVRGDESWSARSWERGKSGIHHGIWVSPARPRETS